MKRLVLEKLIIPCSLFVVPFTLTAADKMADLDRAPAFFGASAVPFKAATYRAVNASYSTTCAEYDNVTYAFYGPAASFTVTATHPIYPVTDYTSGADFSGCGPSTPDPVYPASLPRLGPEKILDNGINYMLITRGDSFWRPQGMTVRVNGTNGGNDIHFLEIGEKIPDANEWPVVFVLYSDGNVRLVPFHTKSGSDPKFGTSVIIGPANEDARPYCDIDTVNYITATKTLNVTYRQGGSASIKIEKITRSSATLKVTVNYPASAPFCTVRSMYVTENNCDCARIKWKTSDGATRDSGVMALTEDAAGKEWFFYRATPSIHNQSAPDIRIKVGASRSAAGGDGNGSGGSDTLPANANTTYEGFAHDSDGTVHGTVTVSAKATLKNGVVNWTFSAKAIMQAASLSFSGKDTGAVENITLVSKSGEELDVALGEETFHGTLSGGTIGTALTLTGARNTFANKNDVAASEKLATVKGLYNVALVEGAAGAGDLTPSSGYLTLNVGNLGTVKLAGKLADGTAVSGNVKLLEGLNANGWYALPLYKSLYTKKGFVGGVLWLNPKDKLIRVDTAQKWFMDWVCQDPQKTQFARALDVIGGAWTGSAAPLSYMRADVPETLPPPLADLDGDWVSEAFPWDLPITVAGASWSLPPATAPKKDGTEYIYSGEGMNNPSVAKLTYTAKTGIFKGTFKLYFDGEDTKEVFQHKTADVPYMGVMVPTEDGGVTGLGTGTVTINKQKIEVPVFLVR